jgi:hypothetical protein
VGCVCVDHQQNDRNRYFHRSTNHLAVYREQNYRSLSLGWRICLYTDQVSQIYLNVLFVLLTSTSMILYLEYSRKLPYTGGELVYVCKSITRKAGVS